MRKLASIKQIKSIEPIKGKDFIVLAHIDGWQAIVQKNEFKVNDLVVFCEPDSVMPPRPEFEFLAKRGYRIKTMKMGGVLSQGLVLPMSVLPKNKYYSLNDDVTELLGITQYEKTMDKEPTERVAKTKYPKWLMRYKWFRNIVTTKMYEDFPSFLTKTDETRIQNIPEMLEKDCLWTITEKVDGTSGTFALRRIKKWYGTKYEFYVCSRNRRILVDDGSVYWEVAKKYRLKEAMMWLMKRNYHSNLEWLCIQGEIIAPKIQGNKYKVNDVELYVFNLITSKEGRLTTNLAYQELKYCANYWYIANNYNSYIPYIVPVIESIFNLQGKSVNDLLDMSNGYSEINPKTKREGFVIRSTDGKYSFKVVSPDFLIAHDE